MYGMTVGKLLKLNVCFAMTGQNGTNETLYYKRNQSFLSSHNIKEICIYEVAQLNIVKKGLPIRLVT